MASALVAVKTVPAINDIAGTIRDSAMHKISDSILNKKNVLRLHKLADAHGRAGTFRAQEDFTGGVSNIAERNGANQPFEVFTVSNNPICHNTEDGYATLRPDITRQTRENAARDQGEKSVCDLGLALHGQSEDVLQHQLVARWSVSTLKDKLEDVAEFGIGLPNGQGTFTPNYPQRELHKHHTLLIRIHFIELGSRPSHADGKTKAHQSVQLISTFSAHRRYHGLHGRLLHVALGVRLGALTRTRLTAAGDHQLAVDVLVDMGEVAAHVGGVPGIAHSESRAASLTVDSDDLLVVLGDLVHEVLPARSLPFGLGTVLPFGIFIGCVQNSKRSNS